MIIIPISGLKILFIARNTGKENQIKYGWVGT
jgi:hypothetical protein